MEICLYSIYYWFSKILHHIFSNTTNRVNDNFNAYQKTNNEIIEKGIDTTNKY